MIPVRRPEKPEDFDRRTREPGLKWLETNDYLHRSRPLPTWSWCAEPLREAFEERCGWAAVYIADGHVEHFISWNECKHDRPELAYEWSNYRYILPRLNSKKRKTPGLLDPYDVRAGWFRVELPSLLLVCTDAIPVHEQARAQRTIEKLGLVGDRDPRIRRLRAGWLRDYRNARISMAGLHRMAPLVGQAVTRVLEASPEELDDDLRIFRDRLVADRSEAGGSVP